MHWVVSGRKSVLAACLLLATCAGAGCGYQRPRHGFILRGDWSLELNRVPWLASHGPLYQCSCPSCGTRPSASGPVVVGSDPCGYACSGDGCLDGGCIHNPGPAAQADESTHPKFHAVPTRPAFSPPTETYYPGGQQLGPDQPMSTMAPPVPRKTSPRAPVPEPATTPSDDPGHGWRPTSPEPPDATRSSAGWIFTEPGTADSPTLGQKLSRYRTQKVGAARRGDS